MFATFVEEDEPCVYGTRPRLSSSNPVWANFEIYSGAGAALLPDATIGATKCRSGSRNRAGCRTILATKSARAARAIDPPASALANGLAALALAGCIAGTAAFLWSAERSGSRAGAGRRGRDHGGVMGRGALIQSRLAVAEALFLFAAAGACAASSYQRSDAVRRSQTRRDGAGVARGRLAPRVLDAKDAAARGSRGVACERCAAAARRPVPVRARRLPDRASVLYRACSRARREPARAWWFLTALAALYGHRHARPISGRIWTIGLEGARFGLCRRRS